MDNSTHENPRTELLIRYLDGEMGDVEKAGLENQLPVDPEMQKELDNLRLAREAVKQYGLREQVRSVRNEMLQELSAPVRSINNRRRVVRYTLTIAACAIVVLLAMGGFYYYQLTPKKVYAGNYEKYYLPVVRDNQAHMTPIDEAYREGRYVELEKLTKDSAGAKEKFLRGIAEMEKQNYPEAIYTLQQVISKNESAGTTIYKDDAEYYLALAHIRLKQYNQALILLKKIKDDPQHIYHSKVSNKLMRDVKMLKWKE